MKSHRIFRFMVVFLALAFGAVALHAQDLGAIKARMEQRLGSVNELKDRSVAGENNRGFLEARGSASGPEQQIISEENSDRRAVYAALAQQTGATPDAVGRLRAQQIASMAKRGHWVQDPNGEWRQKG